MSLSEKFDAALAKIAEHNEAVGGVGNPGYVDPVNFTASLKALGATSENRLKALSFEDILSCFPADSKPKLLAKDIAEQVFRESSVVETDHKSVSSKKATQMTPIQLIQSFDPEDPTNAVGIRLSHISKGLAFIVYLTGRIVDVDASHKVLQELRQNYPEIKHLEINGVVKQVYRVGELPDSFADENPLYPNRPLRPDGTCDQTGRSWEGIDIAVRQLVYLVTKGANITRDKAHDWLDKALEENAMKKIRSRNPEVSIEFDKLAATGNLPTLKIALGTNPKSPGVKQDLKGGKKVNWVSNAGYYVADRS